MEKAKYRKLKFSFKNYLDYFTGRVTLARMVHDQSAIPLLNNLKGTVIELGAGKHDYSEYAKNSDEYIKSNINKNINKSWICVDSTNMPFEDNQVDGFVCLSVLEHIPEYQKVIDEAYRTLKPGGQMLLIVPWVFPFHAAPNDYFRFSRPALVKMFSQFDIKHIESVSGYWFTLAAFMQRPLWRKFPHSVSWTPLSILMRMLGILCIFVGLVANKDDDYALLYTILVEKPTVVEQIDNNLY